MSNLIYLAKPMDVGSKGALKGKPKIFIADAAMRNAVLMIDDVLSDEKELGVMVETAVYKHIVSFYQGSTAQLGYFSQAQKLDNITSYAIPQVIATVMYPVFSSRLLRERAAFCVLIHRSGTGKQICT